MDVAILSFSVVAVLLAFSSLERKINVWRRRTARLEQKVDLLIAHLDVRLPGPDVREVEELARAGRKVAAIRKYRELTGAELPEAREAVERMPGGR